MKNRELMGTLMIITYFIWKIFSSFIADDLTKYTVIALFCIVNIILAFRISTLYHGERIIYIGLNLMLFSLEFPLNVELLMGTIGIIFILIGAKIRYIRVGSLKQFYNWSL
ncbi:MAG: hypothetical protein WAT37_17050 [Saprospiraceae bacterium]